MGVDLAMKTKKLNEAQPKKSTPNEPTCLPFLPEKQTHKSNKKLKTKHTLLVLKTREKTPIQLVCTIRERDLEKMSKQ
jgi:hypothetical protein